MLWNSVLQACLQAYSKVPILVSVLLAHRQLVQLVHNHAVEEQKRTFIHLQFSDF